MFRDRAEAGRLLAVELSHYADRQDVGVIGLPRGGVVVAFEVARRLKVSLDILVVRKLGVPGREELAMGAIAAGGVRVINEELVRSLRIPGSVIDAVIASEETELERRERVYRGDHRPWEIKGKTVILIDDGIATGATMLVAIHAVRKQSPACVVVAAPISSPSAYDEFEQEADEMVVLKATEAFCAVAQVYENFSQVTDAEVVHLMELAVPAGC